MNKISKQIPHQNDVLMANKHMKRYLVSYGISELWIKTTINHFIFSRMTKFQKTQHQILVRVWNSKNSYSLLQGPQNRIQNATATLENILTNFIMLNTVSPYDSAIRHLGVYPNSLKTYIHTKTYMRIFTTATLIMIAKTWSNQDVFDI